MKPHLSQTMALGDTLYTSGQIAIRPDGTLSSSCAEQARECLEKIGSLLQEHGLARTDVIKVTVWLKRPSDFQEFNGVYASFFGEHKPARSTVVADLVIPEALIEIEAIARMR